MPKMVPVNYRMGIIKKLRLFPLNLSSMMIRSCKVRLQTIVSNVWSRRHPYKRWWFQSMGTSLPSTKTMFKYQTRRSLRASKNLLKTVGLVDQLAAWKNRPRSRIGSLTIRFRSYSRKMRTCRLLLQLKFPSLCAWASTNILKIRQSVLGRRTCLTKLKWKALVAPAWDATRSWICRLRSKRHWSVNIHPSIKAESTQMVNVALMPTVSTIVATR